VLLIFVVGVIGNRAMLEMEKDFDSKLKIQRSSSSNNGGAGAGNVQRSKSFAFRAPQENYTIQDFELGKIYGVGSYSKVLKHNQTFVSVSISVFVWWCLWFGFSLLLLWFFVLFNALMNA
jgi:hypothetical protein